MAPAFRSPEPAPRRIVVRGLNWLGDAVMSLPALERVRQRFPGTHLAVVTPEKLRDLWTAYRPINEVLAFSSSEGPWKVARTIRAGHFDLALILPNSPRSALESWFAAIPRRVGYARPWRSWFLTQAVPACSPRIRKRSRQEIEALIHRGPSAGPRISPDLHQTRAYLRLAAAIGADPEPLVPRLEIPSEEITAVRARWLEAGGKGAHVVGPLLEPSSRSPVCLGVNASAAYGPAKRWPVERFAAAIREFTREAPSLVLGFGTAADRGLNEQLGALSGVSLLNLAGQTSLRDLMALLKCCHVLLTNDSGPMHLAAALGTPVVVPFGSTSPELTGPGLPGDGRHRVLRTSAPCSPCFRRTCPIDFRCMREITVTEVVQALRDVSRHG